MPEEFTLESLAQAMNEDANPSDEHDDNAQPDVEAQNDEPAHADEQQDATGDDDADEPEEGEEGDDDQPETESADDRVVKWKTADGTEHEVPEKELRDGYMRAQDYTQKTQNLARERETAEREIQTRAQQSLQVMNVYGEKLGELHAVSGRLGHLESSIKTINREDDPQQYTAVQTEILSLQRHRDQLTGVLGQANQLLQSQQMEQIKQQQRQTADVLRSEIPEFDSRLKSWNEHATSTYGFTPDELSQVVDPRIFRLLDDATKFRELQSRKPAVVEKVKATPPKPAKQTRSVPPSSIEKVARQFKAAPSIEGMAALMSASAK